MPLIYDRKTGVPSFEMYGQESRDATRTCAMLAAICKDHSIPAPIRTDAEKAAELIAGILSDLPAKPKRQRAAT